MPKNKINPLMDRLSSLRPAMHRKDFLLTWKQSEDDLRAVLLVAEILEEMYRANISARVFDGGLAVSIFRDKSTRTRFSFASAASLLGLTLQELDETKSQIAHGETVRETANMISFVTEVIGIRDDMFLGEGHTYMAQVAAAVEEGFREGVLPQRPAVINLQCDLDHPTQSMADLLHLQKTFGSLETLRGKKIAMTWAYSPSYGKPLSVPQGIITLMTRFGMEVVLAHPEGYDLVPETRDIAAKHAQTSGGSFRLVHGMEDAFRGADIVYPKSWAPYKVMGQRTALLRVPRAPGAPGSAVPPRGVTGPPFGGPASAPPPNTVRTLDELEKHCLAENAQHKNWECTEKLMSLTKDGQALYMHCLPADISGVSCEAGEVAASVFDHYRIATYREAAHKPFIIAAMMLLTRFEHSTDVLRRIVDAGQPRRR